MNTVAKVFYVLYYAAVPAMLVMYILDAFVFHGNLAQGWKAIMLYLGIGLGLAVVFGGIAHILIARTRTDDCKWSYILTFPPYIVIWLVLLALLAVVKFIDIMIYMFTGGEKGLGNVVSFFFGATFGNKKKQTVAAANSEVYTVIDSGFERVLTMVESKQDADPDSPYYTKYYNRFRDDLGYYWRSYDQNEHFIKETVEQRSRGY